MKNYIVRVENGKAVIYGDVGSEDDGTAPVYIFETQEAHDAAVEDGLIPIGALVVKTYDAIEMAGGPFDPALSPESENAPQNKVVDAAVARLDQAIADAIALRASLTGFGMGKICPVDLTDVTEANGLVCGAFEKNAAVQGTLAHGISEINERLQQKTEGKFELPNGLKVCWGSGRSMSGVVDVSFPILFSGKPNVIACAANIGASANPTSIVCPIVVRAEKEGATIVNVYYNGVQLGSAGEAVNWIAIGY